MRLPFKSHSRVCIVPSDWTRLIAWKVMEVSLLRGHRISEINGRVQENFGLVIDDTLNTCQNEPVNGINALSNRMVRGEKWAVIELLVINYVQIAKTKIKNTNESVDSDSAHHRRAWSRHGHSHGHGHVHILDILYAGWRAGGCGHGNRIAYGHGCVTGRWGRGWRRSWQDAGQWLVNPLDEGVFTALVRRVIIFDQ